MNANQTPYSSPNTANGPKQLRRSQTDRKISGVCGGIAEYLNVDANLVRLLVVIGTIVTGGGLAIAYLVALVIMPDSPPAPVWHQATGQQGPGYPQGPAYPQGPGYTAAPPAASPKTDKPTA